MIPMLSCIPSVKRAMTLVELVVVIAISSVLLVGLAIVFSGLSDTLVFIHFTDKTYHTVEKFRDDAKANLTQNDSVLVIS